MSKKTVLTLQDALKKARAKKVKDGGKEGVKDGGK